MSAPSSLNTSNSPRRMWALAATIVLSSLGGGLGCRQETPVALPAQIEATPSHAVPGEASPPQAAVSKEVAHLEAPPAGTAPIAIDVYVDYVCPWCYIGTTRLDRAIAASGLAGRVVVRRLPFLLDADVPDEGVDLAERLRQKYNRDPKAMFAQVEAVAKETGIPLDFSKQPRIYSTVAAHVLMRHAIASGASEAVQRAIEAALFKLHFVDGGRISDHETLVQIAVANGLAEAPTRAALADPAAAADVRRLARADADVQGVPYFRFPGGETLSGAQPEATLTDAIKRAAKSADGQN